MGQAGAWSQLFAAMDQDHPTVELPGHGRAPDWDQTQDYQTQARDLALAKISGPTHLVGHSFGAAVALRLAIDRPDLIRTLTLIEPVFFKAAFEANPSAKQDYAKQVAPFHEAMQSGNQALAAEQFAAVWGGVPWNAMRPEQQSYMIERMPLIVAGEPSIVDDNAEVWPRVKSFEKPVLLLEGAMSPAIISTVQQSLLAEFPNAERKVIDGAGHMGPISHPHLFADSISAFQQRH